ncbi:uncharacterized protein BT62DRAFT_1004723 [Guyanagaster necrorhizus]|uniref:Uncharacterized protein n=1 Tax=Guyanagaster necrorhizus TaxID=856835 RepID=A0A9P7VWH1_9AGAR|nr:uncharacterized protein BT62DRAFT_1004723 [Guyanagaster necrorhizus MCA 3950]KAG7447146.1 hypothetical protein BT62DRAFT_1004723 [Guyanagaster necrorhizus MCA 3950]
MPSYRPSQILLSTKVLPCCQADRPRQPSHFPVISKLPYSTPENLQILLMKSSTIATPEGAPNGRPAKAEVGLGRLNGDKKHCWIAYKEVGTLLDSLTHPGIVLRALVSAASSTALSLVAFDVAFILKDLARTRADMEGLNTAKVTDMEYAKIFLSDPCGTAVFMPVEIQAQSYLFSLPIVSCDTDEADEYPIFGEPEAEGIEDDSSALEDQIRITSPTTSSTT